MKLTVAYYLVCFWFLAVLAYPAKRGTSCHVLGVTETKNFETILKKVKDNQDKGEHFDSEAIRDDFSNGSDEESQEINAGGNTNSEENSSEEESKSEDGYTTNVKHSEESYSKSDEEEEKNSEVSNVSHSEETDLEVKEQISSGSGGTSLSHSEETDSEEKENNALPGSEVTNLSHSEETDSEEKENNASSGSGDTNLSHSEETHSEEIENNASPGSGVTNLSHSEETDSESDEGANQEAQFNLGDEIQPRMLNGAHQEDKSSTVTDNLEIQNSKESLNGETVGETITNLEDIEGHVGDTDSTTPNPESLEPANPDD